MHDNECKGVQITSKKSQTGKKSTAEQLEELQLAPAGSAVMPPPCPATRTLERRIRMTLILKEPRAVGKEVKKSGRILNNCKTFELNWTMRVEANR